MSLHRHLFSQRRGLVSLVRFIAGGPSAGLPELPGPVLREIVEPPSAALIDDFVRFCKGDPGVYRDFVPPHLFPQWSLPMLLQVAKALPYPPLTVINTGCLFSIHRTLPRNARLAVRGQLRSVEASERSARVAIRVETCVPNEPVALRADLRVLVRLPRPKTAKGSPEKPKSDAEHAKEAPREKKPEALVAAGARELARVRLRSSAGLDFAELTGDFNPIHWLPPFAKSAGFRNVILHGFGTSAIAFEALVRGLLAGRAERIRSFEASFVRPLVLPATVSVFLEPEGRFSVGEAPRGPAHCVGGFELAP